jgi:hypothetical protein
MSNILPSGKQPITRTNPKLIMFYGMPKVGKTKVLTELEDNLILDTEGGTEMYEALKLKINSISGPNVEKDGQVVSTSLEGFVNAMYAEAARQKASGEKLRFPYKFITVDTLDLLEDMCEVSATAGYKQSAIGKTFTGSSVLELPNGGGYYHLRKELTGWIDKLSVLCQHLILVAHVKEKLLNKGGVDVSVKDISLTGKLGSIIAAKVDAIGYMYREQNKPLMVSFETQESTVMGARFPHLAGKRFEFSWDKIFIPES